MPALNPSTGQVVIVSGVNQSPDATLTLVLTAGAGVELSANRSLTLTTGDGDRDVTLSGDLTVEADSIVNQDLTTDATVTFAVVLADLTGSTAPTSIITSGTFADALIAASNVTQHEAALTVTESQISDLGTYLAAADIDTLAELNAIVGDATLIDTGDSRLSDARTPTAHTHTESDISDLGTTVALVADNLSAFAATTSTQLAGVISDETGSGALVFGTSPTLVTPVLGTPTSGTLTNCTGPTSMITSGTFADARISESSVTQHQDAITSGIGWLNLGTATELTISGGVVTATQSFHNIDTESDAATDDLDTINGGTTGDLLVIGAINNSRTVVLKHNTGNIQTADGVDISLDLFRQRITLLFTNSNWYVIAPN